MPLFDLTEFLRLSSALNYNLSAASLNRYNVMIFIINGKRLDPDEKADRVCKRTVLDAISYLFEAFGHKRRRLGPMAVLHPLRSAALLSRAVDKVNLLVVLTQLFHDILEDVRSTDFSPTQWRAMEGQLYDLLAGLGASAENELIQRLVHLTRLANESYYQYIGRMLRHAQQMPELVQVKLADRLDNTLDMHIALQDPLKDVDFFKDIFQLMFVRSHQGYQPQVFHSPHSAMNGARRLYQLFKNAVLLSLIRQHAVLDHDPASQIIFNAVAEASLSEAQRNYIHLIGYHLKEVAQQRELVLDTMQYCYSGRSDLVTKPDGKQLLDGLFSTYFRHKSGKVRNKHLDILYQNKPLMLEASVAFLVIFLSFLNDENYYIKGISARGIQAT